jgi:hypothetical protein
MMYTSREHSEQCTRVESSVQEYMPDVVYINDEIRAVEWLGAWAAQRQFLSV